MAEDVPFQLGGGIRSARIASAAIRYGATRVVVGTAAVSGAAGIAEILDAIDPEHLVVAIDVRDGRAMGGGWLEAGPPATEFARSLVDAGVRRVLVTAIAADGTMAGPGLDVLAGVMAAAPELAVIASGGVGSLEHIEAVRGTGVEAIVVGRALYEGRFTLAEAVAAAP